MQTQKIPKHSTEQKMKLYLYSKPAKRNRKRVGGKHSALRQNIARVILEVASVLCSHPHVRVCVPAYVAGKANKHEKKRRKQTYKTLISYPPQTHE